MGKRPDVRVNVQIRESTTVRDRERGVRLIAAWLPVKMSDR